MALHDHEAYESEHVHQVYSAISSHFSRTRYKPWPIVERFLRDQPAGAVGIDAGAGNGKYLPVNPDVFIVASDRTEELIKIASAHKGHSAVVADSLALPHPQARFDFAISIAVIHHFSTPDRRIQAIGTVLDCLVPQQQRHIPNISAVKPGQALFFVWALEQKGSRRGWDGGDEQDVMVPWVLKQPDSTEKDKTYHRYYHLFREGELESNITSAGGIIVESGYDRDNWWAIATKAS